MARAGTKARSDADAPQFALAILAAALLLCWPAFYNGFPLVHADSAAYLDSIDPRKAQSPSLIFYALFLRLFHWHAWLWPAIFTQALILAHLIYLVLRVHRPAMQAETYLLTICALAAMTPLPWFASLIMPDALASVVALGLFLLGFAADRLDRKEQWYLAVLGAGAIACHPAHLLLAAGLLLIFSSYRICVRTTSLRVGGGSRWWLVVPVAAACVSYLIVNAFSPDGAAHSRAAFEEAVRHLADGSEFGSTLARQLDELAVATVGQLFAFGLSGMISDSPALPTAPITEYIHTFFPGAYADYTASPQFTGRIPVWPIDVWHMLFAWIGVVASGFLAVEFMRRRDGLPVALFFAIIATLVIHAGGMSALDSVTAHHRASIVWLVVFYAVLGVLRFVEDVEVAPSD